MTHERHNRPSPRGRNDPRSTPEVRALVVSLGDAEPDARYEAAVLLGELGASQAARHLLAALTDEDSGVRSAAAWALGELEASSALPMLIDALYDESDGVRAEAALALGRIGDPRAADALGSMYDPTEDEEVRFCITQALVRISHVSSAEVLVRALADCDFEIVELAASGLQGMGRPVVPLLVASLEDERRSVQQREQLARILGDSHDETVPEHLMDVLLTDTDDIVRSAAARSLGTAGSTVAVPALRAALTDPSPPVRSAAAIALGEIPGSGALSELTGCLLDRDAEVRYWAAWSLGEIADAKAIPYLEAMAKDDAAKGAWGNNREMAAAAIDRVMRTHERQC